ncbi:hypothetical protein K474DRAFT_1710905 [Panus rudis PR-1116 ss-1]|nr:hypothetical protein K474DRAFT_1713155 [Panus rudis PR-1116 ss-1]KAI0073244.1 hypothetical protein K474DRAFT_1710905 [Panus rudis PR-1116 ss-1]
MPIEQPEDDDDDEEEPQAGPSNRPNHPAKRARQSKKTKKTNLGQPSTGNAAASGSAPRRLDRTSSDVSTGSTGKGRRASGRVSRQPSRRSNRLRSQGSK